MSELDKTLPQIDLLPSNVAIGESDIFYAVVGGRDYAIPFSRIIRADWFELINPGLPTEYLRLKKPLAADYEIQAWTNSEQFPPTIWESMPLASSTIYGAVKFNPEHFELNGVGQLTLMDGVMTPAQHTHSWGDITSGIPTEFNPSPHGLIGNRHTVSGLTAGHFLRATGSTSYGFGALTKQDVTGAISDWFEIAGTSPNQYLRCKLPFAGDYEIQAFTNSGQLPPTIWDSLPIASTTNFGVVKIGSGIGVSNGVISVVTGAGMVYPPAGIPVSTGSTWGASIVNNSAGWDAAYSWGNHSDIGYFKNSYIKAYTIPSAVGGTDLNSAIPLNSGGLLANYGATNYWTNTPVSMYGLIQQLNSESGNIRAQLAYDIRHGNSDYANLYYRVYNSLGWTGWGRMWHSLNSNLPTVDWNAKNLLVNGYASIGGALDSNSALRLYQTGTNGIYESDTFTDKSTSIGIRLVRVQKATANGSYTDFGVSAIQTPVVTSGITNSGSAKNIYVKSLRNYVSNYDDSGTLAAIYGCQIEYGHYNTTAGATPQTTNAYGLFISPYIKTGTITNAYDIYLSLESGGGTVTNGWGIYQANTKNNYLGGKLGLGVTPVEKIHANGNIRADGNIITNGGRYELRDSSNNLRWSIRLNTSTYEIEFYNASGVKEAWVDQSGNLNAKGELAAYVT